MDPQVSRYLQSLVSTSAGVGLIMFMDMFVYTSLLPILAAFLGSQTSHLFGLSPVLEVFCVMQYVFLLAFFVVLMDVEQNFWDKVFSLNDNWLFILDMRAFYNVGLVSYCTMELVRAVQDVAKHGPMKQKYLGEFLPLAIGQKMYSNWEEGFQTDSSSTSVNNLAAANFVLVVANLFGSITHLLYLNTLYGQVNSLRDFGSQLELWVTHIRQVQAVRHEEDVLNNNTEVEIAQA